MAWWHWLIIGLFAGTIAGIFVVALLQCTRCEYPDPEEEQS